MKRVVNSTVLSNFAAVSRLDLLRDTAACLCIARQRGWGFLTDDRATRQQAQAWNIPLSGTIGVLLLAIQDGRLTVDEGNALLRVMMDKAHYHSPTTDLRQLLL
jgi:predicted nucleic acid-binding protein